MKPAEQAIHLISYNEKNNDTKLGKWRKSISQKLLVKKYYWINFIKQTSCKYDSTLNLGRQEVHAL